MVSPHDFTLIVQGPDGWGRQTCTGLVDSRVLVPCRVQVVADPLPGTMAQASTLTQDIRSLVTSGGGAGHTCGGLTGLACLAAHSPVAQNLLVVVAGNGPPSPALVAEVHQWLARGFSLLGVVAETDDPQAVLPPAMRSLVALRYRSLVTETTEEIVDLVLLAGEERRAFISYAHTDGRPLAQEVFESLARRRFDVYLDRFRTTPSTDFVERIDDELQDKVMVVVVETPASVASTWVMQEVLTAKRRGYGLLALNIGGQPQHPEISNGRRLNLARYDDDAVCAAVERHHRAAVVDQRRRRANAVQGALQLARRSATGPATVVRDGERFNLVGSPVEYSVAGSFRPAGLREARWIAQYGDRSARRPVLYCPRPTRTASRDDLRWLDDDTPVAVVPDGRLLRAAAEMAKGKL